MLKGYDIILWGDNPQYVWYFTRKRKAKKKTEAERVKESGNF